MFNDQETLESLYRQCDELVFANYGLSLSDMRDLHTGAIIGYINTNVFHTALIDEGALDDCESDDETIDIESLADALLVRSLASARPSPALNRPTTQSLKRLLESNPIVVCAYLLNRYKLANWRKLNHRDDSWFEDILHRVKVWDQLNQLTQTDTDASERTLRALAHWLLELDSKCNLHDLTPVPGWFEKFLTLVDIEEFELFVKEFALIATPLIVEADKRLAVGNRMTSSAYVKSWFDNPDLNERKVEIAGRIKGKSRQYLFEKYGDVKVGALLEQEKEAVRTANREKKAKLDSRIIKGRSSRSKAAKLVNKHSAVLDSLFRTLSEVTDANEPAKPEKPIRSIGLPVMVKKG